MIELFASNVRKMPIFFSVDVFRLIFGKIAKVMGGRIRELMSGGAPLSAETQEFIKLCLCCNIRQGYGLTESTSGATTMDGR